MALNLIKELSKQGYTRKKNKSFLLNRVKNYNTQDMAKKKKILFNDPNTFLKLPNETEFEFIINKIPRGPQYDLYDKLIPYTMVGNAKFIKKHKFQSIFGSKSFNRKILTQKTKIANLNKNNENNFDDNEIMNNDIKYIIKDENNSNYQMETSNNNINNENFSDINYQNNIITTNYNDDEYIYKGNNYPEKDKNNEYNNIQDEKIDSSQ